MRDEDDLLAAEYALGTLDHETRERVQFRLLHDPAFQRSVMAWEERFSPLAEHLAPADAPADLWDGFDDSPDQRDLVFATTLKAAEGEWIEVADGAEKKLLFADRKLGTESFLLRLAPDAMLPGHAHRMAEECLMLEGEMDIGDLHLVAGDFHVFAAGTRHPRLSSETGALAYLRGELHEKIS